MGALAFDDPLSNSLAHVLIGVVSGSHLPRWVRGLTAAVFLLYQLADDDHDGPPPELLEFAGGYALARILR